MSVKFVNKPLSNSPLIVVCQSQSEKEPGQYAYIFKKQPDFSDCFSSKVKENSVYLMSCPVGENFQNFLSCQSLAVVLGFEVFCQLLRFFRDEWNALEENVISQIDSMRKAESAILIAPGLYFFHHGSCQFQKWIGETALLKFQKDSTDTNNKIYSVLQQDKKTVELHPNLLKQMAEQNLSFLEQHFKI